MGTGYTRNDGANNIADGNVINASDLDGEFDAIVSAFGTSGHTHDGTAAEGGAVTVTGPNQDFVVSGTEIKPKTTNTLSIGTASLQFKDLYIDGTAYIDGIGEDTLVATDKKVQFRDAAIFINSSTDGQLDIDADTEIEITTATLDINATATDISGTLNVAGALTAASFPATSLTGTVADARLPASISSDITGNAATATTLATARTIGGTSFDGSANIAVGLAATATTLATARTIGGVSFNGSANINLPGVNTAGNQNTSGSAATLTTARTIGGVSFNGSANISLPGVNTAGNQNTTGSAATLTTTRAIQVSGAVTGTANFDGSAAINIVTTATADPTITLGGDLTGSVTLTNLASGTLTATIAATSVETSMIAADAITGAKIADNAINSEHYTDGSIDRVHLAADIIDATKIANNVINSEHYAAGSIDRVHLAADIIDGTKIANDVINSEHYAAGSIDNEHIANDAINSEHYAAGSIDNEHIADNAINSEHYADNSIDALHLNVSGNGTTSQFLRSDGDGSFTWAAAGSAYSAGSGLDLTGTTFSLETDLRDGITAIGRDSNDFISIGTTSIVTYLDGTARMSISNAGALITTGDITAFGSVSDIRLKENIEPITNALDKVSQIGGYTFAYKKNPDVRMTGVIAQEVEKVLPEVIYTTTDINSGEENLAVRYENMIGLLVEAIKELKTEVDTLKKVQ